MSLEADKHEDRYFSCVRCEIQFKKSSLKVAYFSFFSKIFFEDTSPFCGQLIPLFWTSGDVCPGF